MQAKPMLVLSKFEAPSPFGPHSRGKISLWPALLCCALNLKSWSLPQAQQLQP